MKDLTITLYDENGDQRVLTLRGRRGAMALWVGQRLPTERFWARWALVTLARALGATVVPCPPYSTPEERAAYIQGHSDAYHDETMALSDYPNAYARGYWEGKR